MKYFGKTTKNPFSYKGSGKYWIRHLKKWGTEVETIIYGEYDSVEECEKAALDFSFKNNISSSSEWANLQEENGQDGAPVGHIGHTFTSEQKRKLSEKSIEKWSRQEFKDKMKKIQSKSWTPERRIKHSEFLKTFWTEERKKQHASKITGKTHEGRGKGIPKPPGFAGKVSASLKGKSKSDSHRKSLSESAKRRFNRSQIEETSEK